MASAEQQARDLLERMEIEGAQSFSAGELVELANVIADAEQYRKTMKPEYWGAFPPTQKCPRITFDQIGTIDRVYTEESFIPVEPRVELVPGECVILVPPTFSVYGVDGQIRATYELADGTYRLATGTTGSTAPGHSRRTSV